MEERDPPKVETFTLDCQSTFNKLLVAATDEGCCAKEFLHSRDVQQMQDRFNQWAGNLGALQSSESPLSLEHRLRDAPLVRESILNSLKNLHGSIQAATDIALGKRQNRISEPSITRIDEDLSEYDLSSSESDSASVPSSGGRNILAPTSEMQTLISAMNGGLDSLFKTSIFIRKDSSRDRRLRAAEMKPFDSRADIMYVNDRYPSLSKDTTLAVRLGEANARRRRYFKYRRDHDERLSTVAARGDSDNIKAQAYPVVSRASPAKTVLSAATKPSVLADTETTAFVANEAAQARVFEMLEAPKAMSAVSFATSVAEISDEELQCPPAPVEAENGSPFLCPYCFQFQQLKREGLEQQWRKHVLQDLEPYICTFSSCSLDTFQSQHTWFEHELLSHRSRWVCSECFLSFRSSDDLKGHVSQHHSGLVSSLQLPAFIDQSKRPVDSIQPSGCPFCDGPWVQVDSSLASSEEVLVVDLDQFRRHLGNHLQQVALFSLPRLTQDLDQSLRPHDDLGVPDRDDISKGCWWIRDDCGHGWSIVSRKRTTFIALASFLKLWQAHRKYNELMLASYRGHEKSVRLLLDNGADVNAQGGGYGNALQEAVSGGHEKVIQLLLNSGADVNAQGGYYGNALQAAACCCSDQIVQLLLDHGANVNAQGGFYGNALQAAKSRDLVRTMEILIDRGADANVPSTITVNYLNTNHNLLIGLHYSVGYLKEIISEELSSVYEELATQATRSVTLVYKDRVLGDESRSCREEGIREGGHLLCRLENRPITDMKAQTQALVAAQHKTPSESMISQQVDAE